MSWFDDLIVRSAVIGIAKDLFARYGWARPLPFTVKGDAEAAMQTASAMGDDRLQRLSQGYLLLLRASHALLITGLKSG
jgi:hypothetical protein